VAQAKTIVNINLLTQIVPDMINRRFTNSQNSRLQSSCRLVIL